MIRYPVTREKLEQVIDKVAPGAKRKKSWRERALAVTARCKQAKRYTGPDLWSEVKGVYMDLQRYKCAYCETAMPRSETAAVAWDVEHYRPKNRVTPWPDGGTKERRGIAYAVKDGCATGYYLLAHEIQNYAGSCKECNSPLKGDHFPIAGKPSKPGVPNLKALNEEEQPLLLYPIGDVDTDPEEILTFEGIVPVPVAKSGHERDRARVCIDFFNLIGRRDLEKARATAIELLWTHLEQERSGRPAQRKSSQGMIAELTSPDSPHASCARAFVRAYRKDRDAAQAYLDEARKLLLSKEPSLF